MFQQLIYAHFDTNPLILGVVWTINLLQKYHAYLSELRACDLKTLLAMLNIHHPYLARDIHGDIVMKYRLYYSKLDVGKFKCLKWEMPILCKRLIVSYGINRIIPFIENYVASWFYGGVNLN